MEVDEYYQQMHTDSTYYIPAMEYGLTDLSFFVENIMKMILNERNGANFWAKY